MRKYLLVILALLSFQVLANPIDDNCPEHTTKGAPVSKIVENNQYICHLNYAIHYRYDTKTAEYVVEHLDKADITGPAVRKDDFRPDPLVDDSKEAQLADYKGVPFDRGHLVPAADNRANDKQMSESFFLTNMVPQDPGHNRGIWKQLEVGVRNTAVNKDIYVISGTIYHPGYKSIGNNVGIPSELWKIVYDANTGESIAFLFPNVKLPAKDLPKYATSVKNIEQATGIDFFPQLNGAGEDKYDLGKWPEIK